MPKEFLYRGYRLEELRQMSMDDFVKLLPSGPRRKMLRGLPLDHRKLLEDIRSLRKEGLLETSSMKTHCRDMVILPEMVHATLAVHNGKEFVALKITPEMVGHLLGEFAISSKRVIHGNPGVGASRSSMYVPLK